VSAGDLQFPYPTSAADQKATKYVDQEPRQKAPSLWSMSDSSSVWSRVLTFIVFGRFFGGSSVDTKIWSSYRKERVEKLTVFSIPRLKEKCPLT
jgi:hypothetical protein